jgi:glycosyltransferase involved in cell wall biosynthesis
VFRSRRDNQGRIRVTHFVTHSYPTEYFRLIARHTDHSRFEMRVGSLDSTGGLQEGLEEFDIPTFALDAKSRPSYPLATLRLAARLRREKTDVLHTHLFDASLVGLLAARLARTRVAIFTGHHSHEVPLHQRRSLFEVDRFAARWLANVVIAPSPEMRDTFIDYYGCRPEHVELIEHGVDLSGLDPDQIDGGELRSELGLDGKLVIGAISKHFWIKNLNALIEAFAVIRERNPDAHLVVLGRGESSAVADKVEALGLKEHVTILAPRLDVPRVLASFDLFVHAALAESFGLAVVEAMAMRRPVVATPVGIARDIIEDGVSGFRVDGTDASALVEAMSRALESRDRWPEIGGEARRRALTFTPERRLGSRR